MRPGPCKYRADQGRRGPRSGIFRASQAGCSSGRPRYSYSRSTRRPRTGPTHIHCCLDRAAQALVDHRSRRCDFATCTGFRGRSPSRLRSSPGRRHWCRGRASRAGDGNPHRCPGRRKSGAYFRSGPSKKMGRRACPSGRAHTSQARRKGPSCRMWWDRRLRTWHRAVPLARLCSGPWMPQSGCTTRRNHCKPRCSTHCPHRTRRNNQYWPGKPRGWGSCHTVQPHIDARSSTGHQWYRCRRSRWWSDHRCRVDRAAKARPSNCHCRRR